MKAPSSTIWPWRRRKVISTKDDLVNQLMSDKGACRTAPATPGLLNILHSLRNFFILKSNGD